MTNDQQTIDKLFRDLVKVYSTSATSLIGINSMQSAIEELVCNNDDLSKEISKLSDVIKILSHACFLLITSCLY